MCCNKALDVYVFKSVGTHAGKCLDTDRIAQVFRRTQVYGYSDAHFLQDFNTCLSPYLT